MMTRVPYVGCVRHTCPFSVGENPRADSQPHISLFDLPASVATPERTAHLLRVTRMYMSAIRTVPRDPSGASATTIGSLNQSWMVLHA